MKCHKAIISVAGYGTRRLPITKSVTKCMLPIGDRPVVDYVVDDCIKAGVDEIYFVVSDSGGQIESYYSNNDELEGYLKANGKTDYLDMVRPPEGVSFHYVKQDISNGDYGSALPAWLCREFIEDDEHVLVLSGDDFIYRTDGGSTAKDLIEAIESDSDAAMIGAEIDAEQVSRYGVIALKTGIDPPQFDYIQEKPAVEEAKSNMINVSKYIFPAAFWACLGKTVSSEPSPNGEYQITDTVNDYIAASHRLAVVKSGGRYLDVGSTQGWLEANRTVVGDS